MTCIIIYHPINNHIPFMHDPFCLGKPLNEEWSAYTKTTLMLFTFCVLICQSAILFGLLVGLPIWVMMMLLTWLLIINYLCPVKENVCEWTVHSNSGIMQLISQEENQSIIDPLSMFIAHHHLSYWHLDYSLQGSSIIYQLKCRLSKSFLWFSNLRTPSVVGSISIIWLAFCCEVSALLTFLPIWIELSHKQF